MKRLPLLLLFVFLVAAVFGQQAAPRIPFESVPFLKLMPACPPDRACPTAPGCHPRGPRLLARWRPLPSNQFRLDFSFRPSSGYSCFN
jgi:hypothetical protein